MNQDLFDNLVQAAESPGQRKGHLYPLQAGVVFGDCRPPILSADGPKTVYTTDTAGNLAECVPCVGPRHTTEQVSRLFQKKPQLHAMPVLEACKPVGLVRRRNLTDIFLYPYGHDLHGKKPIALFMDRAPLIVEHNLSIEALSREITTRAGFTEVHEFIVTHEGRYQGLGRVMEVLRRITELQIRNASHANPLTGLPGNVRIVEEIERLLAAGTEFCVCYVDLDNFKPYNDVYGYQQGDEVIKTLAERLLAHADGQADFVGHVGGDDFIVLFRSPDWQARCARLLADFAGRVPAFYNEQDRLRAGISTLDRQGRESFYPLLSLSIGAALPSACRTHHGVAALASEAKKQAKQVKGNSLFVERRHAPTSGRP